MKQTKILAIAAFALLFASSAIPAEAQRHEAPGTLRIMSYNVRNGIGMDNSPADLRRTATVIAAQKPDICALQEIDSMTRRSGQVDVARTLASYLPADQPMHVTYARAIPYEGGAYGVALLSREVPLSVKRVPLPGREEARVCLIAEFSDYVVMATHFTLTAQDQITSLRMVDSLAALASAETCGKAVFLAGDLNFSIRKEEAFSLLQQNFSLLTDPAKPTCPADVPRQAIDHIAVYRGAATASYARKVSGSVVDAPIASDHRPVEVTVQYGTIFRTAPYLELPVNNGITVSWVTNSPSQGWIEYGTDTTKLIRVRQTTDGQAVVGTVKRIRLEGLQPGVKYYYRAVSQDMIQYGAYFDKVFGGTASSPFYSFELPTPDAKDFTAVIFNDLHQKRETMDRLQRVLADRFGSGQPGPWRGYDFVVLNGDIIDDPYSQAQAVNSLSYFCDAFDASEKPFFFLRGNHEIRGPYSAHMREITEYLGPKTYGAFNWGDTRLVMLDCGEDKPDSVAVYAGLNDFTGLRNDQVAFLQTELATKAFRKAGKRVLIHHIPIYGPLTDRYNPCYDLWSPLLAKAPFNIAINGHTHKHASYHTGEVRNPFPVVIGGGPGYGDTNTVTVLWRKDGQLNLVMLGSEGQELVRFEDL